jgi:hypothetical protein
MIDQGTFGEDPTPVKVDVPLSKEADSALARILSGETR